MNKKFEDIINEQGRLIYTNVGDSMYPLIKPRDLLIIEKISAPLKKNDVPLYKRDSGQYVLHRIIKIKDGEYYICGDNRSCVERGITDRHMIGVLTEIVRDGENIPVYSGKYKAYNTFLPVRRNNIRIKNNTNRVLCYIQRKIKKVGGKDE